MPWDGTNCSDNRDEGYPDLFRLKGVYLPGRGDEPVRQSVFAKIKTEKAYLYRPS